MRFHSCKINLIENVSFSCFLFKDGILQQIKSLLLDILKINSAHKSFSQCYKKIFATDLNFKARRYKNFLGLLNLMI